MAPDNELDGVAVQGDTPNWEPLLRAVGEAVTGWFMWMFEVRTSDGRRLDAYKHWVTRGYVHLDRYGNSFYFAGENRYRRIELWRVLEAVLTPWWEENLSGGDADDIAAAQRAIANAREPRRVAFRRSSSA